MNYYSDQSWWLISIIEQWLWIDFDYNNPLPIEGSIFQIPTLYIAVTLQICLIAFLKIIAKQSLDLSWPFLGCCGDLIRKGTLSPSIVARLQTPVKNSEINLRPVVEVQIMYLLTCGSK